MGKHLQNQINKKAVSNRDKAAVKSTPPVITFIKEVILTAAFTTVFLELPLIKC